MEGPTPLITWSTRAGSDLSKKAKEGVHGESARKPNLDAEG